MGLLNKKNWIEYKKWKRIKKNFLNCYTTEDDWIKDWNIYYHCLNELINYNFTIITDISFYAPFSNYKS